MDPIQTAIGHYERDMEVKGSVALIPILGVLGKHMDWFDIVWMGGVDVDRIEEMIHHANGNPDVRNIVLYMSSPGGVYTGLPELANVIKDSEKPIYAFTDSFRFFANSSGRKDLV